MNLIVDARHSISKYLWRTKTAIPVTAKQGRNPGFPKFFQKKCILFIFLCNIDAIYFINIV
jgi:hypothetical protein